MMRNKAILASMVPLLLDIVTALKYPAAPFQCTGLQYFDTSSLTCEICPSTTTSALVPTRNSKSKFELMRAI